MSITPDKVAEWKAEFLTVFRNIPDRVTWDNVSILRDAVSKMAKRHDLFISMLVKWEDKEKIPYASFLRKAWWDFYMALLRVSGLLGRDGLRFRKKARDIPAVIADLSIKHPDVDWVSHFRDRPEPTQEEMDASGLDALKKELLTAKRAAAAKARKLWEEFDDFIRIYPSGGPTFEGGEAEVVLNRGGITFIAVGVGDKKPPILNRLPGWVDYYLDRITKVAPVLLKCPLPVHLHFGELASAGDAAARYEGTHISFSPWSTILTKSKEEFSHVLAHEMGHHLYHLMGEGRRQFWDQSIRGDATSLRVGDIIARKLPDESPHEFEMRVKKEDPLLYLQVESLHYRAQSLGVFSVASLVRAHEEGRVSDDTVLNIQATPITAYAGKNPSEAFCEALGLLVGYGSNFLHQKVLHLLKEILPSGLSESVKTPFTSLFAVA